MITLTIGYVSGIIAAAIFVLQFVVPNALIVVLVGLLKNDHSAVTWSVVERNLLSSHWPVFLRSDSAATRGVDTYISVLTWLRPLSLTLVTIAAIVTPLGLYDSIAPEPSMASLPMVYVADTGPFGYGTPPRDDVYFTRRCEMGLPLQCPGTTSVIDYEIEVIDGEEYASNATWDDIDLRIPKVLAELYQSGLNVQPKSISSFFDIQSRQYGYSQIDGAMQNKSYITDAFRFLSTLVLDNAYEAIEGLVVDTKHGSIGFRNHTVPEGAPLGAEWEEDLLFIEPETQCVSMNVSLEFRVPTALDFTEEPVNITLVDEGGMSTFIQEYPELDLGNAQTDPQLRNRAYKAGWMTNAYNMLTMNITNPSPNAFSYVNSHVGARYPLVHWQTTTKLDGISVSSLYMNLLDPTPLSNISAATTPEANFTNPFNINSGNFSDISLICSGAGRQDITNVSNIHVECGLAFGAARRRDGVETLVFEPGAWYRQPVYSCASATKASIKTVEFRYNATRESGHSLKALTVVDVKRKNYTDKESIPLWGIEDVDFRLSDLSQLWGIIDPEMQDSVNLSTVRSEHLYLPGFQGLLAASMNGYQNIPGTTGPRDALNGIYDISSGPLGLQDYTGGANYAMLVRWRELSRTAETMPSLLNVIWADMAANLLVGTRSWNTESHLPPNLQDPQYKKKKRQESSSQDENGRTLAPVKVYQRRIRYRWYFAIPAFMSVLLVGLIVGMALILFIFGRASPSRVNHYLVHLSSGRLLGSMQYPTEDKDAPTPQWISRVGRQKSDLHRMSPAYRDEMNKSGGLSPLFSQPTSYGDQGQPASADYDTRPRPVSAGGKGYVQVATTDQPGDETPAGRRP